MTHQKLGFVAVKSCTSRNGFRCFYVATVTTTENSAIATAVAVTVTATVNAKRNRCLGSQVY